MKDRLLTITVKCEIHKYLTEPLQSNIVKTERNSELIDTIKPYLCLEPDEWESEPIQEGYTQLQIELPDLFPGTISCANASGRFPGGRRTARGRSWWP